MQVYTSSGAQLILYSLVHAINELPREYGMQVHRSHWVAYPGIASIEKKGRQAAVRLVNNVEIPVSRSYQKRVMSWKNNHDFGGDLPP